MAGCASCHRPLNLQIYNEESDENDSAMAGSSSSQPEGVTVPDDVELACGCRFHWQCLLDGYNVAECPNCARNVSSVGADGQTQILCTLRNEGGVQEGLDLLPVLNEELYLKAYPDDRKYRAFQEFCRAGDVEACVDLLKADDGGDDDEDLDGGEDEGMAPSAASDEAAVLLYQDPIGSMRSALHIAVMSQKVEVVWLLLFLASNLSLDHFSPDMLQAAERLEIERNQQVSQVDIRTLKDSEGKLARDYVQQGDLGDGLDVRVLDVN